jgi:MFS family permease
MNSLQAGWPVGAAGGGLFSAGCAQAGLPVGWSLCGLAVLAVPLACCLPLVAPRLGPSGEGPRPSVASVRPVVAMLGVIAFAAFVLEGALTDWPGVLLHENLGASQTVAALAYPLFQAGMLAGRLAADRVRARFGVRATVVGTGLVTTAAILAASMVPAPVLVVAGAFAAGIGTGPLLPIAVSVAGRHGDAAVAQLGVIGYVGMLAGPLTIGTVAEVTSLPASLTVIAVLMGTAIVLIGQILPES